MPHEAVSLCRDKCHRCCSWEKHGPCQAWGPCDPRGAGCVTWGSAAPVGIKFSVLSGKGVGKKPQGTPGCHPRQRQELSKTTSFLQDSSGGDSATQRESITSEVTPRTS